MSPHPEPRPEPTRVMSRLTSSERLQSRLHRFKRLIVQRGWLLLLGAVVGMAAGFVYSSLQTPFYSSYGAMIVNMRLSLPEGSVYTEELSNFLGTQTALMQSSAVINKALAHIAATQPELSNHHAKLRVSVLPRTTIFSLQATSTNPAYARLFLQSCMDEYIAVKRDMRAQTSEATLAGLTEEVRRLEMDLQKADAELVGFQSNNSVILLQEQANAAGTYLAGLTQRLAALKLEYEMLKSLSLEQNLERANSMPGTLGIQSHAMRQGDPGAIESEYFKARQQILLLRSEQEELSRDLRPQHPRMIAIVEEIARREKLLNLVRQQSVEQLESRKTAIGLQIDTLEKEVADWDAKALAVSRKTAEFQRLKSNAQRLQDLYHKLLATMQTLDVNKEISPESVTINQPATPAMRENLELWKVLTVGTAAGLLAALSVLLFLDKLDDRLTTAAELAQAFGVEVLGQVPKVRISAASREIEWIQPDDGRYQLIEAYRSLRSSLFWMGEGEDRPKSILITSSVPAEGKTITSANLAITLAEAGVRVLLVDADLRKGRLHTGFKVDPAPGLKEVLSGETAWETSVRKTGYRNLFFLSRGAVTQRSSEMFLAKATSLFLQAAANQYDLVLLDTAPVMAADDVTSLAPLVDGILFVLRADHTSARVARAAMDALYQRQARILGLVFNSVSARSPDYHYYKYRDYYAPKTLA